MGSRSQKIYLSLFLSLIFFTVVVSILLPKYLDESKGDGIKELDSAPKINFSGGDLSSAVTRFPTRAFDEVSSAPPSQPKSPVDDSQPAVVSDGPGGLPTRTVPGVNSTQSVGDRVTTRAYLQPNSAVFSQPQTTATVLGRVGSQTKVRWLAKSSEGWQEILLKDGRSAYVQSDALSFSADNDRSERVGFNQNQNNDSGPDASTLPGIVESFLNNLSANDLLRAETFLSPLAARLDASSLVGLAPYVGSPASGRVLRIELVSGSRAGHRRVTLVYGPSMEHEVRSIWEWDDAQNRWMLVRWD